MTSLIPQFGSMFAQPAVQAVVAGLLTGAIVGSALVASGLFPRKPQTTATAALLACPGTGPVLARIPAGQNLLVTGRSADGAWLQVYVGEPGVDRAWAPATSLRLQAAVDGLPVSGCDTSTATQVAFATSGPSLSPSSGVVATVVPTSGPTLGPGETATAAPSPNPGATPTLTASATATATATPTSTPTPSAVPTPVPTAMPTPTPFVDTTAPVLTNLQTTGKFEFGRYNVFGPSGTCLPKSVTISVTAIDPDDAVSSVRLYYLPPGGSVTNVPMAKVGAKLSHLWQYQLTAASTWSTGQISYWVAARDSHNNLSATLFNSGSYVLYKATCIE